jgi:hypothetical protein
MGFWRKAFRNISVGAIIGYLSIALIFLVSSLLLLALRYEPADSSSDWLERLFLPLIGGIIYGSIIGLGCTRPDSINKVKRFSLVIFPMVGAVPVAAIVFYSVGINGHTVQNLRGFALLGPSLLAGIICGLRQFSAKSR